MNTYMRGKRLLNLVMAVALSITLVGTSTPMRSYSVYAASEENLQTEDQTNDSDTNSDENENNADNANSSDAASSTDEADSADSSDSADSASSTDEADSVNSTDASDDEDENASANSTESADDVNTSDSASSTDEADDADASDSASSTDSSDDADTSDSASDTDSTEDEDIADNSNSGSGADSSDDKEGSNSLSPKVRNDDSSDNSGDTNNVTIPVEPSIYTTEGDIIAGAKVTVNGHDANNAEVQFGDTIKFTFTLKSPIGVYFDEDEASANTDTSYFLKGDETFEIPFDNSIFGEIGSIEIPDITYDYEGETRNFAQVSMAENGITIRLIDDNENPHKVEGAHFGYEVSLSVDSAALQDKEEYEFSVAGVTYKIHLKDNERKAPTMVAESTTSEDDEYIEWKVTITNDSLRPMQYENGYTVDLDIIEDQKFVPGSLKLNENAVTVDADENTKVIPCVLTNDQTEQNNVITFRTKPDVDFVASSFENNKAGLNEKTLKISAKAKDGDADVCSAEATATVSKSFNQWITKSGGAIDPNGEASWEVVIDTNHCVLSNLTLYDKFATDTKTEMRLLGEVTVKKFLNGQEVSSETISSPGKDSTCDFKIDFGSVNGAEIDIIKVTYKTKIENFDTFQYENHTIPANKAWLSYEYESGKGGTMVQGIPSVAISGDTVQAKAGIDKSVSGYDENTHQITWKVVANKNKRPLNGVTIKDTAGAGQKLVSIYDIKLSDNTDIPNVDFNNGETDYTINFEDKLNGNSVTFYVITEITDKSLWSTNNKTGQAFTNKVDLYMTGFEEPIASDTATKKIPFTFVTMSSSDYNYDTHTIDYEITVKDGKFAISDVVATDELGKIGVDFVDGTLTVNNQPWPADKYSYADGVLTINGLDILDNDTDKVIRFTGKVKDETISSIPNGGSKILTNNVTVKTSDNRETGVTVSATNTVKNNLLTKAGIKNNGIADFTVRVNGGKLLIAAGTAIRDVMGKSFELVDGSVHIFKASVNPSTGELTKGEEYKDVTITTNDVEGKTELGVKFNSDTRDAYILEYSASPENPEHNDYVNSVSLVSSSGSNIENVVYNKLASAFSGATSSGVKRFILTVSDEEDPSTKLSVTYDVFEEDNGVETKIDTVKTGDDGLKKLFNKLDMNKTYFLRQVDAPEGYVLDTETKHYVVNKKNSTTYTLDLTLKKLPEPEPQTDTPQPNTPSDNETPKDPVADEKPADSGKTETPVDPSGDDKAKEPSEPETSKEPSESKTPEDDKKDNDKKDDESKKTQDEVKPSDPDDSESDDKDSEDKDKDKIKKKPKNKKKSNSSDSDKKKTSDKSKDSDKTENKDQADESGDNNSDENTADGGSSDGSQTDNSSDGSSVSGTSNNGNSGNTSGNAADNGDQTNAADPNGDTDGSRKMLAKTGGFFGTFYGYLAGLLMIIGGAIITFKKRKKN